MAKGMMRVDAIYRDEGYAMYVDRIEAMLGGATRVHIALFQACQEFTKIAREERAAKRAEIIRAYGKKDELAFSDKIIYMGETETGAILRWVQIWRPKSVDPTEPNKPIRYNNVRSTKGVVSRSEIRKGAHRDEVELLYQHNDQVIALKEAWGRLAETRRSIRKMRTHARLAKTSEGD